MPRPKRGPDARAIKRAILRTKAGSICGARTMREYVGALIAAAKLSRRLLVDMRTLAIISRVSDLHLTAARARQEG